MHWYLVPFCFRLFNMHLLICVFCFSTYTGSTRELALTAYVHAPIHGNSLTYGTSHHFRFVFFFFLWWIKYVVICWCYIKSSLFLIPAYSPAYSALYGSIVYSPVHSPYYPIFLKAIPTNCYYLAETFPQMMFFFVLSLLLSFFLAVLFPRLLLSAIFTFSLDSFLF